LLIYTDVDYKQDRSEMDRRMRLLGERQQGLLGPLKHFRLKIKFNIKFQRDFLAALSKLYILIRNTLNLASCKYLAEGAKVTFFIETWSLPENLA